MNLISRLAALERRRLPAPIVEVAVWVADPADDSWYVCRATGERRPADELVGADVVSITFDLTAPWCERDEGREQETG